jgi:hypothetical protein
VDGFDNQPFTMSYVAPSPLAFASPSPPPPPSARGHGNAGGCCRRRPS